MEPSSNIKKERPHEGVTRTHIVDEPPASTSHGRHHIDLTALINFTSNETSKLSYPIGCPVWYNFENSDSNHLNFCHGHVKGAAMDCNTRKFVYKIQKADSASVGHDGCDHRGPFDFVIEDDVTYAMSCPVRVSAECGKEFDGEIICSSPIRNERGHSINHVYSILLFIEENKMKVQHGIKSNQVKYRPKVAEHHMIESTASPVHISSELSVEKVTLSKLSHGSNQDTLDQGRLKWTPPSPIKRKALCINNAKWQMNYTSEHVDTPKKIPRKEPELSLHLTVPSWVLKAGENLLDLLNNSKLDIEKKVNCPIQIGIRTNSVSISITSTAKDQVSRTQSVARFKKLIQKLLLTFLNDEKSSGRLLFDLAKTASGSYRIQHAKSGAVRQQSIVDQDGLVWMQLVELPFEMYKEKKCALDADIERVRHCKTPVFIGDSSLCDPYVLVYGYDIDKVTRATTATNNIIVSHTRNKGRA